MLNEKKTVTEKNPQKTIKMRNKKKLLKTLHYRCIIWWEKKLTEELNEMNRNQYYEEKKWK